MAGLVIHPHVLAMIICDQVIVDARTGKQSIIGAFSVINTARFPLRYPCLMVYVAMTEGRGKVPLQLRLIDSDEGDRPVVDRALHITFRDPRQVCELHSAFYNMVFPREGEYHLQLLSHGELLMERRLLVRKIDPKQIGAPKLPPAAPEGPPPEEPPEA